MPGIAELEKFVETEIRYRVQGDGGELRFVDFQDDVITVRLQGECSICPISGGCLKSWLTEELSRFMGRPVQVSYIVSKPYFWDR